MKACFIIKYPPIEGGVSMRGYWTARDLAKRGHQVFVITNANEVEDDYRIYMDEDDRAWYEPSFEDTGGFVRVRHTEPLSEAMMHIPQTNPYVTKLSSVATQVIRKHDCDVIFAHYLQPYGLAAYLASQWTKVPFMVKHAGSDLGRLMKQRDLHTALREVFKGADCVWGALGNKEPYLALGVKEENLWASRSATLPEIFSPDTPPLDLNSLLKRMEKVNTSHVRGVLTRTTAIDPSKPTIGIYGKVGVVKGSFDLIAALGALKRQGLEFNFVALTQGKTLNAFKQAIREHDLEDRTWTLPFIAHWKMPGFIRACTAVCFLERDFPISFHGPTVPKEVLGCGTCLVLSGEIAEKQALQHRFVDRENVLIVDDPKEHAELAAQLRLVIADPGRARAIGAEGGKLLTRRTGQPNASPPPFRTFIEGIEARLIELGSRARNRIAAPELTGETRDEKRKARLKTRLPGISVILNGPWDQLVGQYCRDHASVDDQFTDAVGFCDFLELRIVQLSESRGYLPDVHRYERIRNLMFVDSAEPARPSERIKIGFGEVAARNGRKILLKSGLSFDDVKHLRLVKGWGVRIEAFDYDLRGAFARLSRGEAPGDLPRERTVVLFKKELNSVNLELEINEATEHLLALCDEGLTIEAMAGRLSEFAARNSDPGDAADLNEDLLTIIRDLASKGILRPARSERQSVAAPAAL